MTVRFYPPSPPDPKDSSPRARQSLRRPRVLIVEDHDDTRLMLKFLLEKCGMTVLEAADGETAVQLAESEHPNLILMDASLPRIDGLVATRRIRSRAAGGDQRVPIVFLSGHAEPVTQRAAHDAGCDDYLVKPVDLDRLAEVMEKHFKETERT